MLSKYMMGSKINWNYNSTTHGLSICPDVKSDDK